MRRYHGVYYTPNFIARAMADWAIRSSDERVLEPSFGKGAFIHAAAERLQGLGADQSDAQVFGTDIDPAAVATVASAASASIITLALRQADFLAVEPSKEWSSLDVTLGNPPYVRHHLIEKGTIADYRRREIGLSGSADLWCIFVLHSARFLRVGGRLGFILPGSFMFARYAEQVRERLADLFALTVVIRLAFRSFANSGADERGVVVLCSGYREGRSPKWIEHVAWTQDQLIEHLAALRDGTLPADETQKYTDWEKQIQTRLLGDIAKIGIGFVTGANSIFIIDEKIRKTQSLPDGTLIPVVSRTAQTPGIVFSTTDHRASVERNEKVWLFAPKSLGLRHGPVRRYLAKVSRETRRKTLWFRKRPHWYQPEIGPRPNAVLTYMNHLGPRIVILEGAHGATNTFHTLTFPDTPISPGIAVVALAMLTSYAQLSAERVGRTYGGGVLKIEPSEARRIKLPIPTRKPCNLDHILAQADAMLKRGEHEAACQLADDTLLHPMLGADYLATRALLLDALAAARSFRHYYPRNASISMS